MTTIGMVRNLPGLVFSTKALLLSFALLLLVMGPIGSPAWAQTSSAVTAPNIEIVEDEEVGIFTRLTEFLIDFQRRANVEISTHMKAIERGDDLGAFLLGLAIAFAYGVVHALGPGHGKFVIMSYFMGREVRIGRGMIMAVQVAVVHVIAAVAVVWLADIVLKAGFGIGLSDIPGVRAGSFLIIAGIGIYMFYKAAQASFGQSSGDDHGHGHSHGHGESHGHGGKMEGGILAFAAGVVPCPGAVLIMLYAVANNMVYPGFILVAAMSVGIGLSICTLGVGAIMARKTAMRMMERSAGGGGVNILRHTFNYAGATIVTLIGLVSFVAFLDVPLG